MQITPPGVMRRDTSCGGSRRLHTNIYSHLGGAGAGNRQIRQSYDRRMRQRATRTPEAGPLWGVRVLELAGLGPAPFAAMLLAQLGADVVRIERPGVAADGWLSDRLLTRGRRAVVADLKQPEGVDLVLDLVESSDALIEGFRPGVMERLGLGPDVCLDRNPRLVYGRMTGWGQTGPLATTAGHDINYVALTGALHAIGRAGDPPQVPVNLVGDFGGGAMYLVVGVLAGILHARTCGQGQVVDAAIVDGTAHQMTMIFEMLSAGAWRDERGVNLLDTGAPFYDVYETADGRHMAVGAIEPQFYAELLRLLDLDDPPDRHDPAQWPALREVLAATFGRRTQAEWAAVFAGSDACVTPVLSLTEAMAHPHLVARGTYARDDGGSVRPAPAPRFSDTADTPSANAADT
jgi:alpha-methylacyl-CoA racemase